MWLQLRMYMLLAVLFGIVYAIAVFLLPGATFLVYAFIASVLLFLQYLIGPAMIKWTMGVREVSESEEPELHRMVEELAGKAGISKPKVMVSRLSIPNAFAYGNFLSGGHVCVTQGILDLLTKDELKAVLGHEISHLKNRDVAVITALSVIPTIMWYVAWSTLWSGGDSERGSQAYVGLLAFLIYFLTNLLVLYGSRIREYYADLGSVRLGNAPHHLATALYKLVYGAASTPRESLRQMEGYKAFFLNDPSRAASEISELREIDVDLSGTIDPEELQAVRERRLRLSASDRLMELLSTHPNMLKRIKQLSSIAS